MDVDRIPALADQADIPPPEQGNEDDRDEFGFDTIPGWWF